MRTLRITFLLLPALILAWFGFSPVARAQLPFGAFIILGIPCTTTPGFTLVFQAPVLPIYPYSVMVGPGTVLFPYFAFLVPGAPVLGMHEPVPIPCFVGACPYCVQIGAGPLVLFEGTGL